jgi:large subunit ribosomal protein L24
MAARIKKGDKVVITVGKDKGKTGVIGQVITASNKVIVQGLNTVVKHVKPSQKMPQGGVVRIEAPIHLSNVMHVDPKSGVPTRIGFKVLEDGKKVRYAKKTGELIDN